MDNPTVDLDSRLTAAQDVTAVELDGETVIYTPVDQSLHHLDSIATTVWQCLDGASTLSEIAADLAAAFDAPTDVVSRDVQALAGRFLAQGLATAAS